MRTIEEITQYVQYRVDALTFDYEAEESPIISYGLQKSRLELEWLQEFLKEGAND